MFQLTDLFAFLSSDLICIAALLTRRSSLRAAFQSLLFILHQMAQKKTKRAATALLFQKYTTKVVWSTESYKMLASTPGQSGVDAHSCSVFVNGELSIFYAKGQLLLAGPLSRGLGQKSVRVVS